jgi:hypothetical protein
MNRKLAVAIPTCSYHREDIRIGYVLEALAMQPPSEHFDSLDVYIWDEGSVSMTADRWVGLMTDLLVNRGHSPTFLRRPPSRGVAAARRDLLASIPPEHKQVLLVDDDLVPYPGSIDKLLSAAASVGRYGFIQGTKVELDATRTYVNDINQLSQHAEDGTLRRLWFGDAAFLLVSRAALGHVRWDVVAHFTEEGLPGEDVAMTLMIADQEPCFGVPSAAGYHLSLSTPRWRWEVPSDLLQMESLRDIVSAETLALALPHLSKYIQDGLPCRAETSATTLRSKEKGQNGS